jgi:membrane protease YdiL (CAAX protease family)
VLGAQTTAGEEIGWRGYMLTRLIVAGAPRPVLLSGFIWGLWHLPLIAVGFLYADHPSIVLATVVFLVSATSAGVVIAKVRLESGSIWPAIALHSSYNSVIQTAYDPARAGENAPLWVGQEAGLLIALTLLVAAVVIARTRWTYRSAPDVLLASRP